MDETLGAPPAGMGRGSALRVCVTDLRFSRPGSYRICRCERVAQDLILQRAPQAACPVSIIGGSIAAQSLSSSAPVSARIVATASGCVMYGSPLVRVWP